MHEVAQRVQARPLPDRSAEWIEIAKHKERIAEWLGRTRPLRLSKIHTLLKREGIDASYDTLCRYAMQELGWHKPTPTVRLEDPPAGQEAQVDFGQMGRLLDVETDRQRMLWVLVITLCPSFTALFSRCLPVLTAFGVRWIGKGFLGARTTVLHYSSSI